MKTPRHYAIGDIHGCADQLEELLTTIVLDWNETGTDEETPVILPLGDYTDRGPNAPAVLDLLSTRVYGGIPIVGLLGNHDWLLNLFIEGVPDRLPEYAPKCLRTRDGDIDITYTFFKGASGWTTLSQYGIEAETVYDFFSRIDEIRQQLIANMPSRHRRFFAGLLPHVSTKRHFFVHAGIDWDLGPLDTNPLDAIWIRDGFLDRDERVDQLIVHGHSIVGRNDCYGERRGRVNIDTGCFKTGILTCGVFSDLTAEHRFLTASSAPVLAMAG